MSILAPDDLQALCDEARARLGVAGAQVAVVSGPDLSQVCSGAANVHLDIPVTDDTLFQIGSTTKVYTAALVLQLVDAGLVDIDAPATDYLPQVLLAEGDDWRAITPRQLMSMTSGLDNGPYTDTGRGDDCVARYVDLLADVPLTFPPGTGYGYSNASTNVSGLLIEHLTGQNWDDALRDRLLAPAGLLESVSLFEELPYHRVAVGYSPDGEAVPRPWCFSRGCGPAGSSLATSARDLARFGQILLRRGIADDGSQLLSRAALDTMQEVQMPVPAGIFADAWCVGPYLKQWGDVEVFGHSGTNRHGSSTLIWIPQHDVVVATVVNTPERGYPFADAISDAIVKEGLGVPKPPRPAPDDTVSVDAARYVGEYHSYDRTYVVSEADGRLMVAARQRGADGHETAVYADLLPIGTDRFLPTNDALTDHHTWDIAFVSGTGAKATFLHNGAFVARRGMTADRHG